MLVLVVFLSDVHVAVLCASLDALRVRKSVFFFDIVSGFARLGRKVVLIGKDKRIEGRMAFLPCLRAGVARQRESLDT